jgi:hypothetical protein
MILCLLGAQRFQWPIATAVVAVLFHQAIGVVDGLSSGLSIDKMIGTVSLKGWLGGWETDK